MSEAELEAFLLQCATALAHLDPGLGDLASDSKRGLDANRSLSAANRTAGLRVAARDVFEMTKELPGASLEELETALRVAGLPLSRVRAHVAIDWTKVLKRGVIRSEQEYYGAVDLLNDLPDSDSGIDRNALADLIRRFEDEAMRRADDIPGLSDPGHG